MQVPFDMTDTNFLCGPREIWVKPYIVSSNLFKRVEESVLVARIITICQKRGLWGWVSLNHLRRMVDEENKEEARLESLRFQAIIGYFFLVVITLGIYKMFKSAPKFCFPKIVSCRGEELTLFTINSLVQIEFLRCSEDASGDKFFLIEPLLVRRICADQSIYPCDYKETTRR